jgi:hypothetical protein
MIDSGFRILKLVLIGFVVIAIPFLFINQGENYKKTNAKLLQAEAQLEYKNDIIKLYSTILSKRDTLSSSIPSVKTTTISKTIIKIDTAREIIFSKDIDRLIIQNGTLSIGGKIVKYYYDTLNLNPEDIIYFHNLCQYYISKQNSQSKFQNK